MPKLSITTDKSLYAPIDVEIDGKLYRVKRMTRTLIQEIAALDAETGKGDLDAAFRRMEILFEQKPPIDKLDIQQVGKITEFIVRNVLAPEQAEKNGSKPGEQNLPS
jgi:hypothetical protein